MGTETENIDVHEQLLNKIETALQFKPHLRFLENVNLKFCSISQSDVIL
jgi:hypothetical protein